LATSLVIAIILASCAFWQPGYWYAHAEKAVERGDWSMAETCLQVLERCAISAIYSDAYALASAADLYQDHYNNNHARVLLERSVPALESAWPYVELGYAQAYYEPYMEREALASYREALSWEPDYVPALFGIADIKNRAVDSTLHDPRGARDLAKKAVIADHGSEPLALLVLAEAQYGCGNTEEAIRLLERALRLRPKNPGLYRDTLSEIKCAASDSLAGSTRVLRPKRAGCPGGGSQR
jgi:tetratricopeptide (TPR) repeat protein